jgi:hypothetical protein
LVPVVSNLPSSCNCINGECGANGQCTCIGGWTSASNGTQCAACAPGYFLDTNGNCESELPRLFLSPNLIFGFSLSVGLPIVCLWHRGLHYLRSRLYSGRERPHKVRYYSANFVNWLRLSRWKFQLWDILRGLFAALHDVFRSEFEPMYHLRIWHVHVQWVMRDDQRRGCLLWLQSDCQ